MLRRVTDRFDTLSLVVSQLRFTQKSSPADLSPRGYLMCGVFDGNRTRTKQLVKLLMLPLHHKHSQRNNGSRAEGRFLDVLELWKTTMAPISQGHCYQTLQDNSLL